MAFTSPFWLDFSIGVAFLIIDTATYLLSFYLTANKTADPHIRYLHFVFIVYGYFQSLLGFIAGLVLARTTQGTTYAQINKEAEEEETLIDNS